MYYQGEVEKNDRRKIITVATAIVVVVLILIVSIIVVATKKSGDNVSTTDTAASSIVEEPKEEPKPDTTKPVETVTVSTAPATSTKAVVDTGPEDTIPMILSFGSLTTAGTAYALSFSSRRKA